MNEMMADEKVVGIEELKILIWEKIRKIQAEGIPVRSAAVAERLGGGRQRGLVDGECLCIMGVLRYKEDIIGGTVRFLEKLGVPSSHQVDLEAGFEEWFEDEVDQLDVNRESDYFILGLEVALQLEKEEIEAAR